MKKKLNKEKIDFLLFGDTISTDMYCRFVEGWDTAFILPELGEEEEGGGVGEGGEVEYKKVG